LGERVELIADARRQVSVRYSLQDCYLSAYGMFYLQDPSLLEFQRRFQSTIQKNNLSAVFGVREIPSDTQLRDILDSHDYGALGGVFVQFMSRLQRSKRLEEFRFYDQKYLMTIDGSEYFNSEHVHCRQCLSRKKSDGTTEYFHQIVQPALVHPAHKQVLPLAPEFIRRQDGSSKQDCETVAARRLVDRLRSEHPQLPAILVADSLYATAPAIRQMQRRRFSFLIVVKPGANKSLFADIEGLRRGRMMEKLSRNDKHGRRLYQWSNHLSLGVDPKSPVVNFMELQIFNQDGKLTYHNSWVTDIEVNKDNIELLVSGARSRWKIENEGFNTLKNQGYHLEHNFGHGQQFLSEAFFLLNLLAFFTHQILDLVDELYQRVRAGFSARVEFWAAIRATFRILLFESWDQVLLRMNAPPQPAFPS
jgi:hypothetical protein